MAPEKCLSPAALPRVKPSPAGPAMARSARDATVVPSTLTLTAYVPNAATPFHGSW